MADLRQETDGMAGPGDATLARAAQGGDAAAFGALFERHRARLHAVAIRMLGWGPDADDAVQDAILIAMRRLADLRDPAAAGSWLVTIVINVCRARIRRPAHELPRSDLVESHGTADTVLERIERSALSDWVWTALERLSDAQRLTVMLRYFSGASSYSAIADICDVPVGTVRSRLNAARQRLGHELLATAATAHAERDTVRSWSIATGEALRSFQDKGDPVLLESVLAPDVEFRMADRVERRGRNELIAGLAHDFEDGVTAQPLRIIPGEHVAITDLLLTSPPDKPLHCPPAVTQVHFHHNGRTHRLVSYYAHR